MVMTKFPTTEPGVVVVEDRAALHMPRYKVLLHNDDHNTMDHVVMALMNVFRFGKEACERIMLETHNQGVALCTVEPLEQAEYHRDQLQAYSLAATIEPE